MTKKMRIGVLGCSSIADRSILPAITRSDKFNLVAVASRSDEKGKSIASKYSCSARKYEELIESDDIDSIYISLPVGLHHFWGAKCLKSGKHLLMEKTFTVNIEQAYELIELSKSNGLIAMEDLVYVYHPLFQIVHKLLSSGKIGRLRHIEAYFGFPDMPPGNIKNHRNLGGGAILDALIYPLSFCLSMNKEDIQSINSRIIFHEKYDVDARGFIKLDWKDISATIGYGFGFMYRNAVTLWGENGYMHSDRVFTRTPENTSPIQLITQDNTEYIDIPPANHFELMLNDFYNKVYRQNASGYNEGDDILRRMKIISKIYDDAYGEQVSARKPPEVSVVIPVYYAEKEIAQTVTEIRDVLEGRLLYEIILVNDGSKDGTFDAIEALAHNTPNILALNLMRNFGQHNAIMAGLSECSGQYIVCLDDDGQHDPSYIHEMIMKLREGFDVVYSKYDKRQYNVGKNLGSWFNEIVSGWLIDKPSKLYLSSFKAFSSKVKDQIIRYTGPYPYIDGIILSITQNITSLNVKHRSTVKVLSTYSFRKLVSLWLNMFTNFSIQPLRVIFILGSLTFVGTLFAIAGLTILRLTSPDYVPQGWTMLSILILLFGAIQLICIGFVGEYVGRILLLNNKRPQYIIKDMVRKG